MAFAEQSVHTMQMIDEHTVLFVGKAEWATGFTISMADSEVRDVMKSALINNIFNITKY